MESDTESLCEEWNKETNEEIKNLISKKLWWVRFVLERDNPSILP